MFIMYLYITTFNVFLESYSLPLTFLSTLLLYSDVVAGPRILEHMVDTVIFMTGEEQEQLRVVRTIKNRLGS